MLPQTLAALLIILITSVRMSWDIPLPLTTVPVKMGVIALALNGKPLWVAKVAQHSMREDPYRAISIKFIQSTAQRLLRAPRPAILFPRVVRPNLRTTAYIPARDVLIGVITQIIQAAVAVRLIRQF